MSKLKSFPIISRLLFVFAAGLLTLSGGANAAVFTVSGNEAVLPNPLVTDGVPVVISEVFGPGEIFYYSFTFSTDGAAAQGSSAVVGLELEGLSGFVNQANGITLSLFQGTYVENDVIDDIATPPIDSEVGTNLSNVSVLANTNYSLIISGVSESTPNNIITGSLAITSVPLPAAAWLFGSAILGLTVVARRRRTPSIA